MGAITGPVFGGCGAGCGVATGVLPLVSAVLPLISGPLPFASGVLGFTTGGGGGVTSLRYFKLKSETMTCLSETFAFNLNDASCGIAKTMSPVMLVSPYKPDFARGPLIVTVPLTVFAVTFGLLTRSS